MMIAVFTLIIAFRPFRSSRKLPYEQITMQQAAAYMTYESDFKIIDVSTDEEYAEYHIPQAISIRPDKLEYIAAELFPDQDEMIYVCGRDARTSRAAALKMCELGYTSITEIGDPTGWKEIETEEGFLQKIWEQTQSG